LRQVNVRNKQSDATSDALLTTKNQVTRCGLCKRKRTKADNYWTKTKKERKAILSQIATSIGLAALRKERRLNKTYALKAPSGKEDTVRKINVASFKLNSSRSNHMVNHKKRLYNVKDCYVPVTIAEC
jgi:hypothetical protein